MFNRQHALDELEQLIADEIRSSGTISFARFMELALYEPKLGYYRNGRDPFGAAGDFYTAEQLQPVFGELIAGYAEACAQHAGDKFQVLELGAGRAELEPYLRRWGYRAFDFERGELPTSMSGLVIAHEFFDALPVHLLRKERNGWKELRVGLQDGEFAFVQSGEVERDLIAYAQRYGRNVEAGGVLEVSLAAKEWIARVSAMLTRGRLLTVDYGYETSELSRFPAGSLMCYRRHHAGTEVLRGPGTKDITAHVNLTALKNWASCGSLAEKRTCSFSTWTRSIWPQQEFGRRWEEADMRWKLQWKQLVFGLGETFRVVEFEKEEGKNEKAPERPGGGDC